MLTELQLLAKGNILPSRFVSLHSTDESSAVQSGDNAEIIGVAQPGTNKPAISGWVDPTYAAESGQSVLVAGIGSVVLVEAGANVTPGKFLKSDSQGRAVPVATTGTTIQNYGAVALQGGAAGDKIRVQVVLGKVRPALS